MAVSASKSLTLAFRQVPGIYKVLTVLFALLLVVWRVGDAVQTTLKLPAELKMVRQELRDSVGTHSRELGVLKQNIKDLKATVDLSLCYNEAQAGVRKTIECVRRSSPQ
jgi:hypothetical protein